MKKFKVILVLLLLYAGLLSVESERIASFFRTCDLENSLSAEVTEPTKRDSDIAMVVRYLMQNAHISERTLDEELSQRTIDGFLKTLDPQKLYFYESDINTIKKAEPLLGDLFKKGDIRLAYIIFKTYLARLNERVEMMVAALDEPMDFTIDESLKIKPEILTYPKTQTEARERVRLRVKYDMLILQVDDQKSDKKESEKTSEAENEKKSDAVAESQNAAAQKDDAPKTPEEKYQANKDKLKRRYTSFQKRMQQLDGEELLELYLTAMTNSYDPHSSYMSPSTLENFEISMSLGLQGIGATLTSEDGGPAEKEGSLKVNDKICGVGQNDDGPIEDVVDMKLDDVVKKIRGKADTVVRLEVIPSDGSANKIIRIVRSNIELKDSEAKGVVFEAGQKANGTPFKIGVIDLPSFYLDMQAARAFGEGKSSTRDVK
ncbi:MAG: PDZ domain-containing protein, partial [Planctomycetia bacterium]|nr:PDZ domain-containing protein [Planctomycetia bacterium]